MTNMEEVAADMLQHTLMSAAILEDVIKDAGGEDSLDTQSRLLFVIATQGIATQTMLFSILAALQENK